MVNSASPSKIDEHLLALVVEVMAHAAAGHDLAAMDEVEVGGQRIAGQRATSQAISPALPWERLRVYLTRVGVPDALRQGVARQQGDASTAIRTDIFFVAHLQ